MEVLRMSGMVERMARAICAAGGYDPELMLVPQKVPAIGPKGYIALDLMSGHNFPAWRFYVREALDALEVMREPTEEMIRDAQMRPESPVTGDEYRRMIRAALAEGAP